MYLERVSTSLVRWCRGLVAVCLSSFVLSSAIAGCSSTARSFDSAGGGDAGSPDAQGGRVNGGAGAASGGRNGGAGANGGAPDGASGSGPDGSAGEDPGASGNAGASEGSGADCAKPTDCEGKDTECAQRTCESGKCGVNHGKSGLALTEQTAGDCNQTVCDGAGGTQVIPDDTDLPIDGNVCTKDVCTNGVRSNPSQPSTVACGATLQFKCDGTGKCGNCGVDADCGQDNICATFKCTGGVCKTTFLQVDPGQVTGDCKKAICSNGSTTATVDDTDLPVDGKPCTKDMCANGAPSNPPLGSTTSCGANSTCDGNGNCVCSDPNACVGKCGTFADACGHSVNCGGCNAPQTCGGGGTAFVCGCTPKPKCFDNCGGVVANGCGGTFTCPGSIGVCICNQGCTPVCGGDQCQCAGFCG